MKLTIGGREYQHPLRSVFELSIGEARAVKAHTGLTVRDWQAGLTDFTRGDPDVLAGLLVLCRYRAGEDIDPAGIDTVGTGELVAGLEMEDGDQPNGPDTNGSG